MKKLIVKSISEEYELQKSRTKGAKDKKPREKWGLHDLHSLQTKGKLKIKRSPLQEMIDRQIAAEYEESTRTGRYMGD